eukprot:13828980-Alexandrium_andersonii.AAC.1
MPDWGSQIRGFAVADLLDLPLSSADFGISTNNCAERTPRALRGPIRGRTWALAVPGSNA